MDEEEVAEAARKAREAQEELWDAAEDEFDSIDDETADKSSHEAETPGVNDTLGTKIPKNKPASPKFQLDNSPEEPKTKKTRPS